MSASISICRALHSVGHGDQFIGQIGTLFTAQSIGPEDCIFSTAMVLRKWVPKADRILFAVSVSSSNEGHCHGFTPAPKLATRRASACHEALQTRPAGHPMKGPIRARASGRQRPASPQATSPDMPRLPAARPADHVLYPAGSRSSDRCVGYLCAERSPIPRTAQLPAVAPSAVGDQVEPGSSEPGRRPIKTSRLLCPDGECVSTRRVLNSESSIHLSD